MCQWPASSLGLWVLLTHITQLYWILLKKHTHSGTAPWLTHESLITIDYCSPQSCYDGRLLRYNQDQQPPALLHTGHRVPVPYGSKDQVQRVKRVKTDDGCAFECAK